MCVCVCAGIYALNCYALRTYILQYRFSCTKSDLLCTQNEKTSLDPKFVYNLADDTYYNKANVFIWTASSQNERKWKIVHSRRRKKWKKCSLPKEKI